MLHVCCQRTAFPHPCHTWRERSSASLCRPVFPCTLSHLSEAQARRVQVSVPFQWKPGRWWLAGFTRMRINTRALVCINNYTCNSRQIVETNQMIRGRGSVIVELLPCPPCGHYRRACQIATLQMRCVTTGRQMLDGMLNGADRLGVWSWCCPLFPPPREGRRPPVAAVKRVIRASGVELEGRCRLVITT